MQVRHVDAGSCNGCEVEIGAAFGPVYDAERIGARLVAVPPGTPTWSLSRGVVTQNMAEPLVNTIDAAPNPRVVVSIGGLHPGVRTVRRPRTQSLVRWTISWTSTSTCPGLPARTREAIIAALRAVTGR